MTRLDQIRPDLLYISYVYHNERPKHEPSFLYTKYQQCTVEGCYAPKKFSYCTRLKVVEDPYNIRGMRRNGDDVRGWVCTYDVIGTPSGRNEK